MVLAVGTLLVGTSVDVLAKKGPPSGGEAGNNLSFPAIFSDNVRPDGWVTVTAPTYATITDPLTQCVGEDDIVPGTAVPLDRLCYYGRKNLGLDEATGVPVLEGEPCPSDACKTWWLQERVQNKWQAGNMDDPDSTTPVVITALDWGDLLESSNQLSQKQVRTEMTLLQDASLDPDFIDLAYNELAHSMSGAVPGTDQSINEVQGTDFPATQTLVSARGIKGYDATVYSRCARLVIQKLSTATPAWNSALGYWTGSGITAPLVNVKAYASTYSAEINAGGSLLYGYNWNTKTAAAGSGRYRITFVIDGASKCSVSNTVFDGTTQIVNPGNVNWATLVPQGDSTLTDEGGLTYVDVTVKVTGR